MLHIAACLQIMQKIILRTKKHYQTLPSSKKSVRQNFHTFLNETRCCTSSRTLWRLSWHVGAGHDDEDLQAHAIFFSYFSNHLSCLRLGYCEYQLPWSSSPQPMHVGDHAFSLREPFILLSLSRFLYLTVATLISKLSQHGESGAPIPERSARYAPQSFQHFHHIHRQHCFLMVLRNFSPSVPMGHIDHAGRPGGHV